MTFEKFHETHRAKVAKHCRALASFNRCDAEDLAQETWLRAFRGYHQLDPNRSGLNWLLSIATRCFLDLLRYRKSRVTEISYDAEVPGTDGALDFAFEDPHRHFADVIEGDEIVEQFLRMMPDCGELFVMRAEGLKYKEIPDAAGICIGTVKSSLHRSKDRAARILAELVA